MSSTEKQTTGLRGGSWSDRFQVLALMVLTLVTAGLAVIVVADLFDADSSTTVGAENGTPATLPGESDTNDPSATAAPAERPRVVFIGDEWAKGAGVKGADKAFPALTAQALNWTFDVDAVTGSGWTKDAPSIPDSRFVDRAARLTAAGNAPDVVILSAQTPSGSPLKEVANRIEQTVAATRTQVPDATVVVILPVANNRADVLCPPAADDLICIDTFTEGWLIPGDRGSLMNAKADAPNAAGHQRLAEFLAEDLRTALPDLAQ